jgi:hypothetical protein
MAIENLLTRLMTQVGKSELENYLVSRYAPPIRDDVLHDGLVGSGETLGGILGTTAGYLGGRAVAGPRGAIAGSTFLAPLGALAGGWAAHGAYRQGQLIQNILSQPENWSVDAAGAIVPVTPDPHPPSDPDARYLRRTPNITDSNSPRPAATLPPPPSGADNPSAYTFDPTKPPPPFSPENYAAACRSLDKWIASLAGVEPREPTEFSPPPIFSPLYRH